MLDFNKDSIFNLKKIEEDQINRNIPFLLTDDEEIVGAYRTVRDQVIFTNKRIITLDVRGITGVRKEYFTLPYTRIQYYSIQTVGFLELLPDAELTLFFANGATAIYEFKGTNNILEIGKIIGKYILEK